MDVQGKNVAQSELTVKTLLVCKVWLALSWLCRVGVSECELGFTAIDVSSGSLGRIHGEGRRE